MLFVTIEDELLGSADWRCRETSLELVRVAGNACKVCNDVRVPPDNHGVVWSLDNVRVANQPCLIVVVAGLDVMLVAIELKGALKDGIGTVSMHVDPGPARLHPVALSWVLHKGCALEDAVLKAVDGLGLLHGAILSKVGDSGTIRDDVVVRLEG